MNESTVKIRWRITGNAGGSTATFRIDDVSLTTLVTRDVSVVSLCVEPGLPTSTDYLTLTATLRNLGIEVASSYAVDFYLDRDNNILFESNELFSTITGPPIPPGDSSTVTAGHQPIPSGEHEFTAIVRLPGDEQTSNDTTRTIASIGLPKGSVLINEIMYAPVADEPEWVELVNCDTDTVNIRNWRLSDVNAGSKSLLTSANLFLPPGGFCIITKDSSFFFYHPSVRCPVMVASFSALNNSTPDAVILYDQRLLAIDSIGYSPMWGGQGGKSLERIDTEQMSTDSRNWVSSQDSLGSTPGRPNSVVRLEYDLQVSSFFAARIESEAGVTPLISCCVCNVGKNEVQDYFLKLFVDSNRDGARQSDELIAILPSTLPLRPSDSTLYTYQWQDAPQGESGLYAVVEFSLDQRPTNNVGSLILRSNYNVRCVVINEIMYEPLADQSEWVELYNRSNAVVDLKNWKISDRPTAAGNVNTYSTTSHSLLLLPHEYVTIAADSSICSLFPYLCSPDSGCHLVILNQSGGISLGNDGDDVVLRDLTDTVIDSVRYSPSWHRPDVTDTKGRSLEKINPDLDSNAPYNWTTSALQSGGTPGRPNSSLTTGAESSSLLSFSPNPFSPDGDGFEDFCLFQYRLPFVSALLHIKIFDIKGRLVRNLANSQISASQGEILWDGLNDDRQKVRIGPYVVLLQATDPNGMNSTTLKGVDVVAARL